MKRNQSIKNFADFLRNEHFSEHTIRSYTFAVRQYCSRHAVFSAGSLDRYKLSLLDRCSPQTVNLRICAINRYISFMQDTEDPEEALRFRSLKKLRQIKVQQRLFDENVLSDSDFKYLKAQLLQDKNLRWYFILRLLAATGVRVSELLQMKYEHLENGFMDVCGKAGKMRRVLIPKPLCREAMRYFKKQNITSGFIILNARREVITARGISSMLKTFSVRYHISERVMHPHAFRHLYAQNFLKKCPDISLLADLLGHDSIETTRIYLKQTGAQQRALVDRLVTW